MVKFYSFDENYHIDLEEFEYERFDLLFKLVAHKDTLNLGRDNIIVQDENALEYINKLLTNSDIYFFLNEDEYEYVVGFLGYRYTPNYDKEYIMLYERERSYRYLDNFDYLINLRDLNIRSNPLYPRINSWDECMKITKNIEALLDTVLPSNRERVSYNFIDGISSLKNMLIDLNLKDNVVIAGGSALYYYLSNVWDTHLTFSDIDLFLVGFDGDENRANQALRNILYYWFDAFGENTDKHYILDTDNTVSFIFSGAKIQIIKRLYRSESEVIHGFDVDSSCILLSFKNIKTAEDDLDIYGTERFVYALKNQRNTVNFSRMSPSYEHRLNKFKERGFDIWIPNFSYFKQGCCLIKSEITDNGGDVLFRKYFDAMENTKDRLQPSKKVSDYDNFAINAIYFRDKGHIDNYNTTFKTLNPSEQANNTFHKKVYNNPILWYPNHFVSNPHPLKIALIESGLYGSYGEIPNFVNKEMDFFKNIEDIIEINSAIIKSTHLTIGKNILNFAKNNYRNNRNASVPDTGESLSHKFFNPFAGFITANKNLTYVGRTVHGFINKSYRQSINIIRMGEKIDKDFIVDIITRVGSPRTTIFLTTIFLTTLGYDYGKEFDQFEDLDNMDLRYEFYLNKTKEIIDIKLANRDEYIEIPMKVELYNNLTLRYFDFALVFRFYIGTFNTIEDCFSTQLYDFNKVVYTNGKIYSCPKSIHSIKHKCHFGKDGLSLYKKDIELRKRLSFYDGYLDLGDNSLEIEYVDDENPEMYDELKIVDNLFSDRGNIRKIGFNSERRKLPTIIGLVSN